MLNASIICPVYIQGQAEYDRTIANLSSLRCQYYPIGTYEVIVVNNASAFGFGVELERWCTENGFKCLHYGEKRSSYAARNVGIEAAQHPIVAFIDADCTADPSWLMNGVKALEDFGGIVAGHIEFTFAGAAPTPIEYADMISHLRQQAYAEWGYSATANLITYREYFQICGLFPEVQSLGDREWCQKSRVAVQYCPEAIVYHPARGTLKGLMRKVSMQARAIHRISPVTWRDLIRFVIPLRVVISTIGDSRLPQPWNKLRFLIVIQLFRLISLGQSWRCLFFPPRRVRSKRLRALSQPIADLSRSR